MSVQTQRVKEVQARVAKGLGLLVMVAKTNWHKEVDLDGLNSESPKKSILGQVFGNDDKGLSILRPHGVTAQNCHEFGFGVSGETGDDSFTLDYVWKEFIRAH